MGHSPDQDLESVTLQGGGADASRRAAAEAPSASTWDEAAIRFTDHAPLWDEGADRQRPAQGSDRMIHVEHVVLCALWLGSIALAAWRLLA